MVERTPKEVRGKRLRSSGGVEVKVEEEEERSLLHLGSSSSCTLQVEGTLLGTEPTNPNRSSRRRAQISAGIEFNRVGAFSRQRNLFD